MTSLDYYCYVAASTGEFLFLLCPPVTPLLLGILLLTTLYSWSQPQAKRAAIVAALLTPATLPLLALLIGTAFVRPEMTAWHDGVSPPVPWIAGSHVGLASCLI